MLMGRAYGPVRGVADRSSLGRRELLCRASPGRCMFLVPLDHCLCPLLCGRGASLQAHGGVERPAAGRMSEALVVHLSDRVPCGAHKFGLLGTSYQECLVGTRTRHYRKSDPNRHATVCDKRIHPWSHQKKKKTPRTHQMKSQVDHLLS